MSRNKGKLFVLSISVGGQGFAIHNNNILYIFIYITKKSQPIKACKSSLYKKQQLSHTEGPLSKGFLLQKFHVTLFREYHRTYSTPTQTHTGSDLDICQDSIHFSSCFKSNSILALRSTLLSKHVSSPAH